MKTLKLLVVANLVLAVVTWVRWDHAQDGHHHGTPTNGKALHASWLDRPPDIDVATALAEEVVTARVVRIRDAELPAEGNASRREPVTLQGHAVTFQAAANGTMGRIRQGERFEVFHLALPAGDGSTLSIDGDPDYAQGEEHVLFLRTGPSILVNRRPTATWAVLSPEGRWRVDPRSREISTASDMEWAQELEGSSSRELMDLVRDSQRRRPFERD